MHTNTIRKLVWELILPPAIYSKPKVQGLAREKAKAFDGATALGNWFDKSQFEDLNKLHFELRKNGQVVQKGTTAQMLWSIDALIAYVSQFFTLKIGTS